MVGRIDTDGGGSVDAVEFQAMLSANYEEGPEMTYAAFKMAMFELADAWAEDVNEGAYVAFLGVVYDGKIRPTAFVLAVQH
eukprot:SAG11_NODE_5025_length_1687_cov_1.195844_2_plen_81_part_00